MTKLGQESGQNGAGGHVTWSRGDGLRSRDDGLFSFYRRGIVCTRHCFSLNWKAAVDRHV